MIAPVRVSELDRALDTRLTVEGIIDDEPDVRENTQHIVVRISQPRDTKIQIATSRYQHFSYGDRVRVEGELKLPQAFASDAGREFDYPHFLAKDGIGYQMSFAQVHVIDTNNGNPVWALLYRIKQTYTDGLAAALSEPEAGLAAGITAGDKRAMGGRLLEDFRTAGVVHIVVLSGYNIAIVSTAVLFMLGRLSRKVGSGLGALAIVLFVIATGGSAAAVRAGVMACLALFAYATNRTYDVSRALIVAAVAMVLWNPLTLLYDPGFQLSVISTIGIIYVSPLFEQWFGSVTEAFGIRSILATTVGTQITVMPFLLYQTGILSIVALPVNLLIVPAVPLSMLLTFIAGVSGVVAPSVSVFVGAPAYLVLSYILAVVDWAVRIPFASVQVPAFPLWSVFITYLIGIAAYFSLVQKANYVRHVSAI
jgi:competence protein ComEC